MLHDIQLPETGQLVHIRQRRYVVVETEQQSKLPPNVFSTKPVHHHHLITLSSVEDDGLGEELQIIWEIEPGAAAIEKTPLPRPVGFDTPQRLDTFLNAVRWGAASSADVKAIQAPFLSGIDLEDYQLDPVSRAIQMPRANLLIADDVGLGKTIEAGLVVQELIIRQRARRILIICPAALQVQWRDQMRDKFGLEFRIVDSELMKVLRRERGLHVNPWKHFPRLITSIDFLKRDRPLRLFREALPADGEQLYPRRFDLMILDEAHNVAPSGQGKYATDSMRTEAIRLLAPHFEHKLFLSATPHNGYRESFTALLELLDNQRFARGVEPDYKQLTTVMVRRLKSELPKRWDGSSRFAERLITPLPVAYTPQEHDAHQLLQAYNKSRLDASKDNVERYATEFVAKLLKKRLFSSPEAFYLTLEKHQQSLGTSQRYTTVTNRPNERILRTRVEQLDEENDNDASLDESTTDVLEAVAPLFHAPTAQEQAQLKRMLDWADDTRRRPDSKAQELIDWLHRTIKPKGKWSNERVIIFTEYRATQNWLYGMLVREGFAEQGPDGEIRLQTLYGGMDTKTRETIKAAFQANPADSSVRILLATDAASEGIDLQNHCSRLIHYEIPWNPNRLEQRNGRIDRHGQRADEVNIYHFVSSRYDQHTMSVRDRKPLDDDLEFLMQAVRKIENIREDLGNVGPVIATQVEEAMLGIGNRRTLDTSKAEAKSPARKLLAFERKQRAQVEAHIRQLYEQLQAGKRELGLTPENILSVVETALELAKQPALQKRILEDPHGNYPPIEVFDVPDLDGSWVKCTEGLWHPHTQQKRPIVFDHTLSQGRDDVVLAHLNHRLVTMSLRLLRAEVWASGGQSKLHRVTARTVPSITMDTPAVIAHARLLILGGDNQRLHEELITAGGYLREGGFIPMKESQLKEALTAALNQSVSETMQKRLAAQWDLHQNPLIQALNERMGERTKSLRGKLAERATKERNDITSILITLKKNITAELNQLATLESPAAKQLSLEGFSSEERQQLRRDIQALEARQAQIDDEIQQEVVRIQQRFADPKSRVFPVAITYLVPAHLAR